MKLLVFLQNAWRRNAGPDDVVFLPRAPERSQEIWESALWACLTGKKLRNMIPEGFETSCTNASPRIGSHAAAKFPMDPQYVREELFAHRPDVVLLCGGEAHKAEPIIDAFARENGQEIWGVKAAHPAWRSMTKAMRATAYGHLEAIRYGNENGLLVYTGPGIRGFWE